MQLMVVAHPDDELIWHYPYLESCDAILAVSNDSKNKERKWCKDRKLAFAEVCRTFGVDYKCLDYNSEFAKLPNRPQNMLGEFVATVIEAVKSFDPDSIVSNNPWGEYGHTDHRYLFQILNEYFPETDYYTTDMVVKINWPIPEFPEKVLRKFHFAQCGLATLDISMILECIEIYRRYKCWTWDFEIPQSCSLFKADY